MPNSKLINNDGDDTNKDGYEDGHDVHVYGSQVQWRQQLAKRWIAQGKIIRTFDVPENQNLLREGAIAY